MKSSDLAQHLALIRERIEEWPEPWASDLADFLARKIEIAASRSSQSDQHRQKRSQALRKAIQTAAAGLSGERPGLTARERTQFVRQRAQAILNSDLPRDAKAFSIPSRRLVADVIRSAKRIDTFGTETTSTPRYAPVMCSTHATT